MQLVYNSDNFVVVAFEVAPQQGSEVPTRGGYEIVDKAARTEIFIDGVLAESFKQGVQAIVDSGPTEEDMDAFIGRYTGLARQPVAMH